MSIIEEHLPILYLLERSILNVWRSHSEMSDHVVKRAYEAAAKVCRAEASGQTPDIPEPDGIDGEAFAAVHEVCGKLRAGTAKVGEDTLAEVSPEVLVQCLRKLIKSVERHNKRGGHQGYLSFLAANMP